MLVIFKFAAYNRNNIVQSDAELRKMCGDWYASHSLTFKCYKNMIVEVSRC